MALFQKKPITSTNAPLYALSLEKTLLIVGLGNPGKLYELTRHNIGFTCADNFIDANSLDGWTNKKDLKSLLANGTMGDSRIIVIKPQTFMNLSGEAVAATANFYKIPTENILVISDELDIPFGQIRTRMGGGSAGHNGIKSIIQHCGDNFARLRIGIQSEEKKGDTSDFVLSKFSKIENEQLINLKKEALAILSEYIYSGGQLPHETRSFIV